MNTDNKQLNLPPPEVQAEFDRRLDDYVDWWSEQVRQAMADKDGEQQPNPPAKPIPPKV